MKHAYLYIILSILGFTSCKSTKSITENKAKKFDQIVVFQVKSLKAINLEEELTFADELVLTYSLTALDENNKIVQVANGSWGVESMKKGQIALKERFKPLELIVPSKSKVILPPVLISISIGIL